MESNFKHYAIGALIGLGIYHFFLAERLNGLALKRGVHEADVDQDELDRGTEVELEHTGSISMARRIALDHLAEDSRYYSKLAKMEA